MKRIISKFKLGQSLIEIIVAMAVMATFGVAIVSAVLLTQKASVSAVNRTEATKYAQQLLEEISAARNTQGLSKIFLDVNGAPNPIVINNPTTFYCLILNGSSSSNWQLQVKGSTNNSVSCPYSTGWSSQIAGPYSYLIWYNCAAPGDPVAPLTSPIYGNCNSGTSPKAVLTISIYWKEAGQPFSINETAIIYALRFDK